MQNNMKRRNKTVKTKNTSTPTDTIKPKYKHTKNRTLNQNAQNNIKQKYKHSRKHTKQINPKKHIEPYSTNPNAHRKITGTVDLASRQRQSIRADHHNHNFELHPK